MPEMSFCEPIPSKNEERDYEMLEQQAQIFWGEMNCRTVMWGGFPGVGVLTGSCALPETYEQTSSDKNQGHSLVCGTHDLWFEVS